ncbi:hypothetical protein U1Q18_020024 [Sarracenia purpurea var. burkii]
MMFNLLATVLLCFKMVLQEFLRYGSRGVPLSRSFEIVLQAFLRDGSLSVALFRDRSPGVLLSWFSILQYGGVALF